jgi:hypothetical protein
MNVEWKGQGACVFIFIVMTRRPLLSGIRIFILDEIARASLPVLATAAGVAGAGVAGAVVFDRRPTAVKWWRACEDGRTMCASDIH